jgi:hypothetical protein
VFTVEAELVETTATHAHLRKSNGQIVKVPLKRLSEKDLAYLRSDAEKDGEGKKQLSPTEHIKDALKKDVVLQFINTPLTDVASFLQDQQGIEIAFDKSSLRSAGIDDELPITANLKGIPLSKALNKICKEHQLDWRVEFESLVITTVESGESHVMPRVYRLKKPTVLDELTQDLSTNIAPDSWADVGGPAAIGIVSKNILIVAQTEKGHQAISEHYGEILNRVEGSPIVLGGKFVPVAMFNNTLFEFIETPLTDVTKYLSTLHKTRFDVSKRDLEDLGISSSQEISANLRGISLYSALSLTLRDYKLTFSADKDSITITTPEAAEGNLSLIGHQQGNFFEGINPNNLAEAITSTVAPSTWDEVGGARLHR